MDFWRSDAYMEFFNYLDEKGGFYYERWGDAPVHSIGAALFLQKDQVGAVPSSFLSFSFLVCALGSHTGPTLTNTFHHRSTSSKILAMSTTPTFTVLKASYGRKVDVRVIKRRVSVRVVCSAFSPTHVLKNVLG